MGLDQPWQEASTLDASRVASLDTSHRLRNAAPHIVLRFAGPGSRTRHTRFWLKSQLVMLLSQHSFVLATRLCELLGKAPFRLDILPGEVENVHLHSFLTTDCSSLVICLEWRPVWSHTRKSTHARDKQMFILSDRETFSSLHPKAIF